jgi:hypothetical protein
MKLGFLKTSEVQNPESSESNSQNSKISFKYVDSQAKTFLILFPPFENSTTRTAIVSS